MQAYRQTWMTVAPMLWRWGCAVLLGFACQAQAQEAVAAGDIQQVTKQWLDSAIKGGATSAGSALRMEVSVGSLDSRLRLAACSRIEPYLPANTQLWGKTRIGLRCLEGAARWSVFLPVTVKAWGPAWVLKNSLVPGSVLRAEDAMQAQVDWASETAPVVAESGQWVGQVAAYSLMAGTVLRQNMIRPSQVFQAGSVVRVLAEGQGFRISSEGQALGSGVVGQLARVRTENGRIVSGLVLDANTVKISL